MTKSEVIRMRVTPGLKAWVEEEARRQNRTVSNYLEKLILQEAEKYGREVKPNTTGIEINQE